jgi:serine/threonine protein kinase
VTDVGVDTLLRHTNNRYSHSMPMNWMYKAHEELEFGTRTMQTDVYSFATTLYCVCLIFPLRSIADPLDQIFMSKPPFPHRTHSYGNRLVQIIHQGHDGIFGRSKPAKMSDSLWQIIRMCWAMDPSHRPSMVEIEGELSGVQGLN